MTIRQTKISELVKQLESIKAVHGDISVVVDGYEGGYHAAVIDTEDDDCVTQYFFKDEAWYYGPWWQASNSYRRDDNPSAPTVKCVHIARGQATT